MAFILGQMEGNTKDIGKMENNMGLEIIQLQMEMKK